MRHPWYTGDYVKKESFQNEKKVGFVQFVQAACNNCGLKNFKHIRSCPLWSWLVVFFFFLQPKGTSWVRVVWKLLVLMVDREPLMFNDEEAKDYLVF